MREGVIPNENGIDPFEISPFWLGSLKVTIKPEWSLGEPDLIIVQFEELVGNKALISVLLYFLSKQFGWKQVETSVS